MSHFTLPLVMYFVSLVTMPVVSVRFCKTEKGVAALSYFGSVSMIIFGLLLYYLINGMAIRELGASNIVGVIGGLLVGPGYVAWRSYINFLENNY